MTRILLAATAAALILTTFGLASAPTASAQPGAPPVCVTLPPGEYTFSAPSQDREGEVSFTVIVGEGGLVTDFTEPGGQSIPPSAMLQIFTGEDAYPLPEGVAIVECEAAASDSIMAEETPAGVCVSLPAGSHSATINAGGQSYEITIHVGDDSQVTSVDVLGQSYSAHDAIALLEGFGASLPAGVEIIPCAAPAEAAASSAGSGGLPYTGSGGLADSSDLGGFWAAISSVAILAFFAALVARRQGVKIRNRN